MTRRLALTGGSGSGKGCAAAALRQRGIPTLDTDALVHLFYRGGSLPRQLADLFGEKILAPDGSVDRAALGQIVFADPEALGRLNGIVHARVRDFADVWMRNHIAAGFPIVAVDAPQLFEAGMAGDFDAVIAVTAPEEDRLRRILARDGITEEKARARLAAQYDEAFFRENADYVLENPDGQPLSELGNQLDAILRDLNTDSL